MHRQFILAAHRGDTDLVAAMIEDGVDVACVNDRGDTPLHMAVAGEHVRIVVALLDAEADCRARDVLGRCCLHVAAETGNDEIMKLLLRKAKGDKKAVNAPARGNCTPLHLAAMLNHATVAHRLLIAGAGLEMADVKGRTPVHHAADAGSIDMINLLGEVGIRALVDFVRSMDCFYYCMTLSLTHMHTFTRTYPHTCTLIHTVPQRRTMRTSIGKTWRAQPLFIWPWRRASWEVCVLCLGWLQTRHFVMPQVVIL